MSWSYNRYHLINNYVQTTDIVVNWIGSQQIYKLCLHGFRIQRGIRNTSRVTQIKSECNANERR